MPPAVGMAIAGIVGALATKHGANKQAEAANQAARIESQGLDKQLAFARESAAEDKRRYDQSQGMAAQQWNAQQAQRAPYRAASAAILGRTMGMRVPAYQVPRMTIADYAGASPPPTAGPGTIAEMANRRM